MRLKSVFLILVLAALAALPASAIEISADGWVEAILAWAIPWVDGRAIIDPNGLETGSCIDPMGNCYQAALTGDDGPGIDPDGRKSASRPEGSGLDPHGGAARGATIDPNGTDQGSGADPNG